jgi:hypothetical protein
VVPVFGEFRVFLFFTQPAVPASTANNQYNPNNASDGEHNNNTDDGTDARTCARPLVTLRLIRALRDASIQERDRLIVDTGNILIQGQQQGIVPALEQRHHDALRERFWSVSGDSEIDDEWSNAYADDGDAELWKVEESSKLLLKNDVE